LVASSVITKCNDGHAFYDWTFRARTLDLSQEEVPEESIPVLLEGWVPADPEVPALRRILAIPGFFGGAVMMQRESDQGSNLQSEVVGSDRYERKTVASETFVPEPLLDSDQAAAIMRIHPKTLQRYARQGIVRGFQLGSMWRFRASDIDRWISEQLAS
jgi:excisionase family DNA binding protein